jgi:hypothetical protein
VEVGHLRWASDTTELPRMILRNSGEVTCLFNLPGEAVALFPGRSGLFLAGGRLGEEHQIAAVMQAEGGQEKRGMG